MIFLFFFFFIFYCSILKPHNTPTRHKTKNAEKIETISQIPQPTHSKNEPIHKLTEIKNEQVIEQLNEQLYIYNKKQTSKNILNNIKIEIEKNSINQPVQNLNPLIIPKEKKIKEKSCAKKEKAIELDLIFDTTPPSLEMILEYFSFKESSLTEANKFFNYYSRIGWLIGGKTKMKDWKAAARNWMLNTVKFAVNAPKSDYNSQPKPMHLHTATQKNYDEPL